MLILNKIPDEAEEAVIIGFDDIVSDAEQKKGRIEEPIHKVRKNFYFNREVDLEKIKFNKIFESLLTFFLFFILTNCSVHKEPDTSFSSILNDQLKDPVEVELTEIFSIDSSEIKIPTDIRFDSKANLYVVEYNSPSVKVFDRSGKPVRKITTSLDSSRVSSLNINNDTLLIGFAREKMLLKYSTDGMKAGELSFESEIPNELEFLSGGNIIGSFRTNLVKKEDMYIGIELKLVHSDFTQKKLISSFLGSYYHGNIDPEVKTFPFTVDKLNKKIYIGIDSDKVYKVHCYDYEMNLKTVLMNNVAPVKFSKEEKEKRKGTAKKFKMPALKSETKPFIESMSVDGKGNLWVRRASDADKYGMDNAVFDIFENSGRYLKSVIINKADRISSVEVRGNNLYIIDPVKSVITAYDLGSDSGSVK